MALQYKLDVYNQYKGCFDYCLLIVHNLYLNLYRGRRMQPGNLRVVETSNFSLKHFSLVNFSNLKEKLNHKRSL